MARDITPRSLYLGAERDFRGGLDARRQGLDQLVRGQDLGLLDADRDRALQASIFGGIGNFFSAREARKAREKAAKGPGFFGSGGGSAVGSLTGAGLGALLAIPTGGLSVLAGAGLGAGIGGAAGGFGDALASGSGAQASNAAAGLGRSFLDYGAYTRGLEDRTLDRQIQQAQLDKLQRPGFFEQWMNQYGGGSSVVPGVSNPVLSGVIPINPGG